MIKVIGKENCGRCKMVKTILKNKGKEFQYVDFETLSSEEQKQYIKTARRKGMLNFPMVFLNNEIIDFTTI